MKQFCLCKDKNVFVLWEIGLLTNLKLLSRYLQFTERPFFSSAWRFMFFIWGGEGLGWGGIEI